MRVDTDRFVVCSVCGETEHFGQVSITKAKQLARRYGWKPNNGEPICPQCVTDPKPETNDGFHVPPQTGADGK